MHEEDRVARITDTSKAGKLLILFLDSECDTANATIATIDNQMFKAVPGFANVSGVRCALTDAIAIEADPTDYPHIFLLAKS